MAIPSSLNARLFYRAGKQRLDDAILLFQLNRTTGAVYLAGYSIEGMLKALILASVPQQIETQILAQFRGTQAHDYEWLIRLYREQAKINIPDFLRPHLSRVTIWSTSMRYLPGSVDPKTAKAFINSAEAIVQWADGRL